MTSSRRTDGIFDEFLVSTEADGVRVVDLGEHEIDLSNHTLATLKITDFDWVWEDGTVHNLPFRESGRASVKLCLVNLARSAGTTEAEAVIKRLGLLRGNVAHQREVMGRFPYLQIFVVATGSRCRHRTGDILLPVSKGNEINFVRSTHRWNSDIWFLATR